jgi:hypothetical protein
MSWTDPARKRAWDRRYVTQKSARFKAAGGCVVCGVPVQRFAKCFACRKRHVRWVLASRKRRQAVAA